MKIVAGMLILVLAILVLAGCGDAPAIKLVQDDLFIIRVTGSVELLAIEYTGSCTVVRSSGETKLYGANGITPMDYAVQGDKVDCTFMKGCVDGLLKVELLRDGEVVYSSYTTDAYGLVWVGID